MPELAAITLATALSRFVSHSWFEAAGKIGSPEYARVQYLFCAGAIAVMVLLAVRNFWRASLLIALVGTALQVFVAYMFGAADDSRIIPRHHLEDLSGNKMPDWSRSYAISRLTSAGPSV